MSLDLSNLSAIIKAYKGQGVDKTLGGGSLYKLLCHIYDLLYKRDSDGFNPDLMESQMHQIHCDLLPMGVRLPNKNLYVPLWKKFVDFSNALYVLAQGILLDDHFKEHLYNLVDAFKRYAIMAYNYELSLFQEKQLREQVKTHEKHLELEADAATEAAAIEATESKKLLKPRKCLKCREPSSPNFFCTGHNPVFLKYYVAPAKLGKYCVFCKKDQELDVKICKKDQNPNEASDEVPDKVICKKCTKRLLYAIPRSHIPGQVPCGGPHNAMWCAYLQNGFKTPGADCCQECNPQKDMVQCNGRDGKRCIHGKNGKRYADRACCGTCNKSQ
jgi:hypothetical protein